MVGKILGGCYAGCFVVWGNDFVVVATVGKPTLQPYIGGGWKIA